MRLGPGVRPIHIDRAKVPQHHNSTEGATNLDTDGWADWTAPVGFDRQNHLVMLWHARNLTYLALPCLPVHTYITAHDVTVATQPRQPRSLQLTAYSSLTA